MAARARWLILPLLLAFAVIALMLWPERDTRPAFPYGEIRIGVDASTPPFAVTGTDGTLSGIDIDLGRAIGAELGLPVRFVNMGIDGLYDAIISDQVDLVIASLVAEPWRTGDVRYTRPYFDAGLVLFSPELRQMQDLPGRRLAYEFGSLADTEARLWARRIPSFETMPYELPEYALEAVRLGLADAALVDAITARLHDADVFHHVTNRHYVIAVHLHHRATFTAVDRTLKTLLEDGTIDTIIDSTF